MELETFYTIRTKQDTETIADLLAEKGFYPIEGDGVLLIRESELDRAFETLTESNIEFEEVAE